MTYKTTFSRPRAKAVLSISALTLFISGSLLYAGPLDPPSGPVTPTYKTLSEVEPRIAINATNTPGDADSMFKIASPGSYYLTGNIGGVSGKSGIEIASPNVTIDLNGFDMRGVTGARQGIIASVPSNLLEIRNGSVGGWPMGGVMIGSPDSCIVANIRADFNGAGGIAIDTGRIENCVAYTNTGIGIRGGQGSSISHCHAEFNTSIGISAGIIATVNECSASSNGSIGIQADGNSVVSRCSSQQNVSTGIIAGFASLVENCVSRSNSGAGVEIRNGGTVRGCTADGNSLDGILTQTRSLVTGNSISQNGAGATIGAGVRVTGADNRIEGNNCVVNDHGIKVEASGNIILGNSCSGNTTTNFEIIANNIFGPIIDRVAPASPAVSGNAAVSTLGTTDPHANFAY